MLEPSRSPEKVFVKELWDSRPPRPRRRRRQWKEFLVGEFEGGVGFHAHHISAFAQEGLLGNDGHKPGTHRGFSACDPSGR
jgi:hypothetical protein